MSWCKRHLWDLYAASQLIDDLSIATDASSLSSGWVYLLLLHGPVHIAEVGGGGGRGEGGGGGSSEPSQHLPVAAGIVFRSVFHHRLQPASAL